jgi:DNA-binding NarL/FixJ family response regulator
MNPISVLLVDDSSTFLSIATQFLQAHDDLIVVGAVEEGEKALIQAQSLHPDVVLVDLTMPDLPGLEVIPRLRRMLPETGIIALTLHNTDAYRQAALTAGADDFIPKGCMSAELLPAIRRVARGDSRDGGTHVR